MGQHLVAEYVTTAEPHERPPYSGLSIEKSTQRCAPTFLFGQVQASLERHLVAKYVTTAKPHKTPTLLRIADQKSSTEVRSNLPIRPGTGKDKMTPGGEKI